jgi:photosynthetic reaction center H subunit
VRYLEFQLEPEYGTGKRLVPIPMAKVTSRWVEVSSLNRGHFAGVPQTASASQITKLEEEKICGWYAGGTLYS